MPPDSPSHDAQLENTPSRSRQIISLDFDEDDAPPLATAASLSISNEELRIVDVRATPTTVVPDEDPFTDTQSTLEEDSQSDVPDWMKKYLPKPEESQSLPDGQTVDSPSVNESSWTSTPVSRSDPEVLLFITSPIPGTFQGVLVKRRISQNLRLVKDAWILAQRKQGLQLSSEYADKIFLTWKGNKIYSATTLRSLGVGPAQAKNLRLLGSGGTSGWDKLHMEAWHEEMYEEEQQRKEKEKKRLLGELDDDEEREEREEEKPAEDKIRITLKAKDQEPVRTSAGLATTMETLVVLYRQMRQIPPNKEVILMFDGDRLEEHMTLAAADLSDMDSIDVLVR
jgi:Ubiquitin-2 like Rad60 SUMO-like